MMLGNEVTLELAPGSRLIKTDDATYLVVVEKL